ncbi:hypothetical protein J6590_040027 [Homalodisca vitripennis]|nr:hypothetical protein J6590_040027 [Homalodisca vitripennis]
MFGFFLQCWKIVPKVLHGILVHSVYNKRNKLLENRDRSLKLNRMRPTFTLENISNIIPSSKVLFWDIFGFEKYFPTFFGIKMRSFRSAAINHGQIVCRTLYTAMQCMQQISCGKLDSMKQ